MSDSDLESRLWARIEQRGDDECWPWQGAANARGYPKLTLGQRREVGALRLLYEFAVGEIPERHWLHHTCGNMGCMNPAHLYLRSYKSIPASGEAAPRAKLTDDQAREILAARGTVTARELAARYGVSPGTIGDLWRGRSWKHLHEK
ncbi:MAG: HNH endonuclease [Ardenticatenales bacterium]|nr:HNH endonuclease [Ardenticatenales bacterium]